MKSDRSLYNELCPLIFELNFMADDYKEQSKSAESDFLEGFYIGCSAAYALVVDLLKELIEDEKESQ